MIQKISYKEHSNFARRRQKANCEVHAPAWQSSIAIQTLPKLRWEQAAKFMRRLWQSFSLLLYKKLIFRQRIRMRKLFVKLFSCSYE